MQFSDKTSGEYYSETAQVWFELPRQNFQSGWFANTICPNQP